MANGTVTITVNGTQQNPVVSVLNQSLRYPSGVLPLPAPTDLGGEYFGWASLSPNGATVKFYLNDVETPIETVGSTRRINLASLMADVTYRYELTFTDSGASYPTARVKGTFVPAKSPGGIIGQNFTIAAPRKETVFDVTPSIVTMDLVWPPNATFYEYLEQGGQLWYAFGPRNLASGGGWVEEIPRSTEVPQAGITVVEAFFKFFADAQAITWPRIGGIDNTATMVYWSSSTPNTKIAMSVGDYNGTWTAYPTDASGNLINLANGTYGYRIEMRRSGATIPWGVQEGTFVRSNGAYTSITPIAEHHAGGTDRHAHHQADLRSLGQSPRVARRVQQHHQLSIQRARPAGADARSDGPDVSLLCDRLAERPTAPAAPRRPTSTTRSDGSSRRRTATTRPTA